MTEVLCVDDEVSILNIYARLLRGQNVHLATNGTEARKLYAEHPDIEVLIVDYDFDTPRDTGIEVTRDLKEKDPSLRVLMITSSIRMKYREGISVGEAAQNVGVLAILNKPLQLKDLRGSIDGICAPNYKLLREHADYFPENEPISF